MKKELKLLAILLTGFSFSACEDPPGKPTVEMCVISEPFQKCYCGIKEPGKPIAEVIVEDLAYCDKATAFPPAEWEKIKNYMDKMEAWSKRNRRR